MFVCLNCCLFGGGEGGRMCVVVVAFNAIIMLVYVCVVCFVCDVL